MLVPYGNRIILFITLQLLLQSYVIIVVNIINFQVIIKQVLGPPKQVQFQYFNSFQNACLVLCHCTHREILNKVRIGDFAVDVPSQLGRRFGTARSAVDLNFVADVVSRKTSGYYRAFVGEIYRRKKNREHRSQQREQQSSKSKTIYQCSYYLFFLVLVSKDNASFEERRSNGLLGGY